MSDIEIKNFMYKIIRGDCKGCGCTYFECKSCENNDFYRHIDDKIKMKANLKTIRERGTVIWKSIKELGDNL